MVILIQRALVIISRTYNRTGSKEPLKNLLTEVNETVEAPDIVDIRKSLQN